MSIKKVIESMIMNSEKIKWKKIIHETNSN